MVISISVNGVKTFLHYNIVTILCCYNIDVLQSTEIKLWQIVNTYTFRSNQQFFYKKAVLNNFAKFTRKSLCTSLSLILLQAYKLVTNKTPTKVFSWKFCEIFQNPFSAEELRAIILDVVTLSDANFLNITQIQLANYTSEVKSDIGILFTTLIIKTIYNSKMH